MLIISGIVLGAIFAQWQVHRKGGNRLDRLHQGAVYAIMFGLVGLIATIILGWSVT